MSLTTRQATTRAINETSGATHLVVKFKEDSAICLVPAKRIIEPPTTELNVLDDCKVKWSDAKIYDATVLALGKYIHIHTSNHVWSISKLRVYN